MTPIQPLYIPYITHYSSFHFIFHYPCMRGYTRWQETMDETKESVDSFAKERKGLGFRV